MSVEISDCDVLVILNY